MTKKKSSMSAASASILSVFPAMFHKFCHLASKLKIWGFSLLLGWGISFAGMSAKAAVITANPEFYTTVYWSDAGSWTGSEAPYTWVAGSSTFPPPGPASNTINTRKTANGILTGLLSFDLGELHYQSEWEITSVTLKLYVSGDGLADTNDRRYDLNIVGISPHNSSWADSDGYGVAGGLQQPSGNSWKTKDNTSVTDIANAISTWDILGSSSTTSKDAARPAGTLIEISLDPNLIKGWLQDPSVYNGIALYVLNSSDNWNLNFYGNQDASYKPTLQITYAIPEPSTAALGLIGLATLFLCFRRRSA